MNRILELYKVLSSRISLKTLSFWLEFVKGFSAVKKPSGFNRTKLMFSIYIICLVSLHYLRRRWYDDFMQIDSADKVSCALSPFASLSFQNHLLRSEGVGMKSNPFISDGANLEPLLPFLLFLHPYYDYIASFLDLRRYYPHPFLVRLSDRYIHNSLASFGPD